MRPGQDPALEIRLERWFDARAAGFLSGDHHIHGAGCAHYTSPTEGVSPEDMFRQVSGEGLNVGCVLTWGPCFDYQRRFFSPGVDRLSDAQTILKYDLEISGFGSEALGHVCLLNLNDQTYPGPGGTKARGWPSWTVPVLRWAKQQGGVTGYAHSGSGLEIQSQAAARRLLRRFDRDGDGLLSRAEAEPALLPVGFEVADVDRDGALTEAELVGAHERAAETLPNLAVPEMNGVGAMELPVSVVAGICDFISAMDTPRLAEWNMWYHLLNCGFPLKVSGETDFPCMSGERWVDIVINGTAVASNAVPADGRPHELRFRLPVARSSWVALRQFPQLHTNPVEVRVGGAPIRASRASARWAAETIERLWEQRREKIRETERAAARQAYDEALTRFRAIAAASPEP